jgi:hypothetical protein
MKKIAMTLMAVVVVPLLMTAGTDKDKKDKKDSGAPEPRVVTAVRTTEPIAIDGRLTEQVWQRPGSNGFTQNDPQDGSPSTEKTDVWVAYDDKALYVAAYCHDSDPKGIKSLLGRRDSQIDSDWFYFAVDPYFDKMSGYLFGVNPAGSILDEALSNDVNEDTSWDGVWESKAAVNGDGWVVEMKVPFNQIRFPKKDEYVWGVNFSRVIKRKQERASFSWVPKDVTAFVSRFARLEGISGISAGMHIELMPYTVGQARFRPAETGNPFETGHRYRGNFGFDLKVGLQSNLTLDTTVNPDFGQVEVDPAVINLSAYETYYEEKRPFFIEGASIFNGFGGGGVHLNASMNWPYISLFYSRRIGREPQGYVTEPGYTDIPERTAILGAAKITGKLGGWNIGFINALTSREYATIDQSGMRLEQEVAPFSYYGVLRAQKDINEGQQGIGFMATGVGRDNENAVLNGILNKNAFSLAMDGWSFLDKKRAYVIGGWFAGTRIGGSAEDILRLQNSSAHYFQRPDATQVEVDPTATSLSGWGGRIQFAKQSGNLLWVAAVGALSPGFDPNDAGYQSSASDVINISFLPGYQWTKPGKLFQYALVALGGLESYDFGGNKTSEAAVALVQGTFKNFWNFNTQFILISQSYNNRLTRGGPLAVSLPGYEVDYDVATDSRKAFVLEASGFVEKSRTNSQSWSAGLSVRWKPTGNVSLSIGPQFMAVSSETQWVGRFQDELMTSTYGSRYVFGKIQQKVISAEIRLNWTFTPRLTFQAYLQPFIGVGKYDRFKELARPKAYAYNLYGQGGSTIDYADGEYVVDPDGAGPAAPFAFGNPDFNMKSLRGTIVLRWEYLPGSLLYFVWTQNRADFAHPGDLQLGRDLGDLFTAPGENIFMLKFSYRWNK